MHIFQYSIFQSFLYFIYPYEKKFPANEQNREPKVMKSRLGSNLNMILCKTVYSSVMERVSKCHRPVLLQHLQKCKDFSTNKICQNQLNFCFQLSANCREFCRRNGLESIMNFHWLVWLLQIPTEKLYIQIPPYVIEVEILGCLNPCLFTQNYYPVWDVDMSIKK